MLQCSIMATVLSFTGGWVRGWFGFSHSETAWNQFLYAQIGRVQADPLPIGTTAALGVTPGVTPSRNRQITGALPRC